MSHVPKHDRLTEKGHWESVNSAVENQGGPSTGLLERIFGSAIANRFRHRHAESYFWNTVVGGLPLRSAPSVLELGSAPGGNLIQFHQRYAADVYGIEYSSAGVATNRELFRKHGLDETHVIQGDVFDLDLDARLGARFDVVFSRGLIEHFADPVPLLKRHADFVAEDGWVIVSIPNLKGLTKLSVALTAPHLIPLHNLEIMHVGVLRRLATSAGISSSRIESFGGAELAFQPPEADAPMARLSYRVLKLAQLPLNFLLSILPSRAIDSSITSPQLVLVGKKSSRL